MSEADERARLVQAALESISAGSKSFRFASQLFDQETRERSWLLYSWCRACDDVTDGQTLGHDAERVDDPAARLAFLKEKTAEAFAGQPTGIVPFDALRVVAAECAIPQAVAGDHLAGFERACILARPLCQQLTRHHQITLVERSLYRREVMTVMAKSQSQINNQHAPRSEEHTSELQSH